MRLAFALFGIGVFAVSLCYPVSKPLAQQSDVQVMVNVDWHLAGVAENRQDWSGAVELYQKVMTEVSALPLLEREWYRGTAGFGLARSASRNGDTLATRSALTYAYEHHFWNTDLIKLDPIMSGICGGVWLDSVSKFWTSIRGDESSTWQEQKPFTFYPSGYDSTHRWPLIIALHGGNACYEAFARPWKQLAEDAHAVVVVPPGAFRESEITNSWGYNMDIVEKPILAIVKDLTSRGMVDPNALYLAGFSQGAQAAIEVTLRHPDLFRGAISMSGFTTLPMTDSTLAVAKQQGVRIYAITGEGEDAIFKVQIEQAHERCVRANIPFELNVIPGMIHEVPLDLRKQFAAAWQWVSARSEAMHLTQR